MFVKSHIKRKVGLQNKIEVHGEEQAEKEKQARIPAAAEIVDTEAHGAEIKVGCAP